LSNKLKNKTKPNNTQPKMKFAIIALVSTASAIRLTSLRGKGGPTTAAKIFEHCDANDDGALTLQEA
jgi:hypothetical protein